MQDSVPTVDVPGHPPIGQHSTPTPIASTPAVQLDSSTTSVHDPDGIPSNIAHEVIELSDDIVIREMVSEPRRY